MEHLPITAELQEYEAQAETLVRAHAEGDPAALRLIHEHHPRFLDKDVRWLPLRLTPEKIAEAPFDGEDARLALARWYSFRDWDALASLVSAIGNRTPGLYDFEIAAEAVITGDLPLLQSLLRDLPDLVRVRSSRITPHDPEMHCATLLHYVAANGVENYRQRTPPKAVEIARALLQAGSEPDAVAGMYGGECTTLSMLVSSTPPAQAGLQTALTEVLLDYGADPNGRGTGKWVSPLMTALVFGFRDTAEVLAKRGSRVDRLSAAAGLGWLREAEALLPLADAPERHSALALAAQLGHVDVVRLLLDGGESPDRYNPDGMHGHATPLHQAALNGHEAVVRLLVERAARLDIPDKYWQGTPRDWAEYGGHQGLVEYLRSKA